MAKKTIVKEAVNAVRDVAGAALDAAAEEARRVIAETVANTAARLEKRAKDALPAVEDTVKERLVKPVDRALGTKPSTTGRRKKKAAVRSARKKARKAQPAVKTAARRSAKRKTTARRTAARKKRG